MWIILFCAYHISPDSSGEVLSTRLSLPIDQYDLIRNEEGNAEKKSQCQRRFGGIPDLAWYRDASTDG